MDIYLIYVEQGKIFPFESPLGDCLLLLLLQMVLLESVGLRAGFQAPDFELPEPLTGKTVKLSEYTRGAKATVLMFICNHW